MQMRQNPRARSQPSSEVCQENFLLCPLSFLQGVEVSFGGEHLKEVNGNDFGTKDQGTVSYLREEGSPHCAGMGYGKNKEGEGSKVAKQCGAPRKEIQALLEPLEKQGQLSELEKG